MILSPSGQRPNCHTEAVVISVVLYYIEFSGSLWVSGNHEHSKALCMHFDVHNIDCRLI